MTAEERLAGLITGAKYENMSAGQYGEFAIMIEQAIVELRALLAWIYDLEVRGMDEATESARKWLDGEE